MLLLLKNCLGCACLLGLLASAGCSDPATTNLYANMDRALEIRGDLGVSGGGGADAEASANAQQPVGWATLRGVFRIDGQAPAPVAIKIDKDVEVCSPGGRQVFGEEIVVGPDGGIGNVVIYLTSKISDDEPWTHPSAQPGKTDEVAFDQKECIFLSHVLAMQVTQPLKILNSDPVGHNTNLKPNKNSGFNQTIPVNGSTVYKFSAEEPAPFRVSCSIHPWMGAWIITRKNSYFAVTRDDGAFELPNLPAGVDLEFRVWQEKMGFVQDVTVDGQSAKWGKGRFSVALDPQDENKNQLDIRIAASAF